jgi:2-dehydropantoate 2-reductase
MISVALAPNGVIRHLNDAHHMTVGRRPGNDPEAIRRVAAVLEHSGFDLSVSPDIVHAMWEKWVFIAAAASITSLMRASIGDIMSAGGEWFNALVLEECENIAAARGFRPSEASMSRSRTLLLTPGSRLNASLARDIETGGRIEADHLIGDLIDRRQDGQERSLLDVSFLHMKSYEQRRSGEM